MKPFTSNEILMSDSYIANTIFGATAKTNLDQGLRDLLIKVGISLSKK